MSDTTRVPRTTAGTGPDRTGGRSPGSVSPTRTPSTGTGTVQPAGDRVPPTDVPPTDGSRTAEPGGQDRAAGPRKPAPVVRTDVTKPARGDGPRKPAPPDTARDRLPLSAKAPREGRRVGVLAVVMSLLALGLGAVAVHDALAIGGTLTGTAWSAEAVTVLDGASPGFLAVIVGLVIMGVGLLVLVAALTPRRSPWTRLPAGSSVYVSTQAVATIARHAATTVPGVRSVTTRTTPDAKVITVTAAGDPDARAEVTERVTQRLQALEPMPNIRVRIRRGGDL